MVKLSAYYFSVICLLSLRISRASGNPSKIDPDVLVHLATGESLNVVVSFGGIQPALDKADTLRYKNREDRNQGIIDALKKHTDVSQQEAVSILSDRSSSEEFKYFKQYWTSNKLFIKAANEAIVNDIAEDPQVVHIRKEVMAKIPPAQDLLVEGPTKREIPNDARRENLYGVELMQIEDAWKELDGMKGNGVLVATIGTGVRHTHEALRDNFVGIQYGWYDAVKNRPEPQDEGGHGTHTMGLIVGGFGVGVAPAARWMTCQSCDETYCPEEALLDCIQFLTCPHLPDGSNPDCSKAPHVISNLWVVDRGTGHFNEDIMRWRAMGVIPVFAVGNDGPACNTTSAPGDHPFVIGVGNTNREDNLATTSSVGLASAGGVKPDIVAPGVSVLSSIFDWDEGYGSKTGTSMSSAYVAGVVALLKVRNLELTFEQAFHLLTQNTDREIDLIPDQDYCDEVCMDEIPNNLFGYGRVNAFKAVQAQTMLLAKKK